MVSVGYEIDLEAFRLVPQLVGVIPVSSVSPHTQKSFCQRGAEAGGLGGGHVQICYPESMC